jgi:hypothetical protein
MEASATPAAQHCHRTATAHFDFIGDNQLVRPSFFVKDGVVRIGRSGASLESRPAPFLAAVREGQTVAQPHEPAALVAPLTSLAARLPLCRGATRAGGCYGRAAT